MNAGTIGKTELINFLAGLGSKYDVFAPVKRDGAICFEPLSSPEDVVFDYPNSLRTPKEFFFPQAEVLFTFQGAERQTEGRETRDEGRKPQVLFGLRPCDSKALLLLDSVFDQEDYQDPYYIEKRKNMVLVGLACRNPQSTCFCTSFGGGPFDKEGLDILVTELDDNRCYVEILTEKGKQLIAVHRMPSGKDSSLKTANKSDVLREEFFGQQVESAKKEAEAKIPPKVALEGLKEKLDGMFDSPLWDMVTERCLGCAVCTYLCPTCHCFALLDEKVSSQGQRIRNWDSCMFPIFTLEASGHNPRASNRERMRQRIMHKFNYFVDNFGQTACVGCGRCLINCPVNMDIREIIETINE
jgi:ferredoxin